MNINLVNLNDAVYRLLHRKFDWLANVDLTNFNKTNCPRLHEHNPREVVTYKDFVTILAGADVGGTKDNWKNRCCAKCDTASQAYLKPWGKTFGKYKGRGGKVPLAEVKPLDEMFWYYDAFDRQLRTTVSNTANACRVLYWYHRNGWQFRWSETGQTCESGYVWTIQPGVYGVCNMCYGDGDSGFNIIDDSGPTPGNWPLTRVYRDADVWRMMNAIFFVDSPVQIQIWWNGTRYWSMQGILFRITPPGYWE